MSKKVEPKQGAPAKVAGRYRKFFIATLVLTGVFLLWGLVLLMSRTAELARFAQMGWGKPYVDVIVSNKTMAVWHAFFMLLLFSGYLWALLFSKFKQLLRTGLTAGLVAVVAVDAYLLSKHYVQEMPGSYLESNNVTEIIKKNIGDQRVVMVTQDSFYNLWLTYLFPYHDIVTFNFTQMPRMPDDYKAFMKAVGQNPLRMWQLSGVGILMGPAGIQDQLKAMPDLRGKVEQLYQYNVRQNPDGGVAVAPASMQYPGEHVVLKVNWDAPRYALIGGWQSASDEQVLAALANPRYALYQQVFLPKDVGCEPLDGHGIVGDVVVESARPGAIHLKTQAEQAAVLRCADRYDVSWKARVDGKDAPVMRADYLFQGIYIPAGTHEVVLTFSPSSKLLYLQIAGIVLCAGAVLVLLAGAVIRRCRRASGEQDV